MSAAGLALPCPPRPARPQLERAAARFPLHPTLTPPRHPATPRACARLGSPVVDLYDRFEHRGHVCLVFERLGHTLLDAIALARSPHEHGASSYLCLQAVQAVARGMLEALAFLHGMGLSHTDLKPENVLFTDWRAGEDGKPPPLRDAVSAAARAGAPRRAVPRWGDDEPHCAQILLTRAAHGPLWPYRPPGGRQAPRGLAAAR